MSKFTTGHCQVTPDPEIQALRNHALADQAKKRPPAAASEAWAKPPGVCTNKPTPADEDILEEARRITSGDRQAQYGPPDQDFKRTAAMWTALKGVEFTAQDVAMFMICLKLSRQTHQRKRDNWVDIAGYARCGSKCTS